MYAWASDQPVIRALFDVLRHFSQTMKQSTIAVERHELHTEGARTYAAPREEVQP